MMKRIVFFLLFSLLSYTGAKGEKIKRSFSLEDIINLALENNYGLNATRIDAMIAEEEISQSKRDLLPNLSASISQSFDHVYEGGKKWTNSGNYGVSTNVVLFNGGQNWNAIRKNKELLKRSSNLVARDQNQLTLDILQSFLKVLMSDELIRYQKELVSASDKQVKQGDNQYSVGQILESDYLLLVAQHESNKADIIETENNRNEALLSLKNQMSISPSKEIEIQFPNIHFDMATLSLPSLQEVLGEVLAWLPDLKIAEEDVEISKLNTKMLRGNYAPVLSLGGSLNTGYTSTNSDKWGSQLRDRLGENINISLSIPIWDRGSTRSNVKKSKMQEEQAELNRNRTESEIRKEIENLYYTINAKYNRYKAAESKHAAQKEVYNTYCTKFEVGSITAVELLQQETNYLSALNTYVQNKYDYLLNRKAMDVYMGKKLEL